MEYHQRTQTAIKEDIGLKTKIKTEVGVLILSFAVAATSGLLATGVLGANLFDIFETGSISPDATITIISPNGGESWPSALSQTVKWTSQGMLPEDRVSITARLQTSPYTTYNLLDTSSTINDGIEFTKPVGQIPSDTYQVEVRYWNGTAYDISNNNFAIGSAPSIMVLSLDGGENIAEKSTSAIRLLLQGITLPLPQNVHLEGYLKKDGQYLGNLLGGSSILPDGRVIFNWEGLKYTNLTNADILSAAIGSGYSVFFALYNESTIKSVLGYFSLLARDITGKESKLFMASDQSDTPFSIVPPLSITVLFPNGGEKFTPGWTIPIQWSTSVTSSGIAGDISLEESPDGLGFNQMIASDLPNSGIYNWTIPSDVEIGDNYHVRVCVGYSYAEYCELEDYSDISFSIASSNTIPLVPSNLVAATFSSTQIKLTWSDNSNNETMFKIERKDGLYGTWAQIATTAANVSVYTDSSGLIIGKNYYYRIRSSNPLGDSKDSGSSNAKPELFAPSNLTAIAASGAKINLAWKDNSPDETGFKIERKTGLYGTWAQIATVPTNAASFLDAGLIIGKTYYYRVRAYTALTDSNYSVNAKADAY